MKKLTVIFALIFFMTLSLCSCQYRSTANPENVSSESTEISFTTSDLHPSRLHHTVTDLSSHLPQSNLITPNMAVSYINSYVDNGTLYVYSQKPEPHITPFSADGTADTANAISVPKVNGQTPLYAQKLSGDRFCLIYENPIPQKDIDAPDTELMTAITDPSGTVITQVMIQTAHADIGSAAAVLSNYAFLISEEAEGNVRMVFSFREPESVFFYDNTAKTITKTELSPTGDQNITLREAMYLGEHRYLLHGNAERLREWNASANTCTEVALHLPASKEHFYVTYGADGKCYLYDGLGIYQYRDNLPPVKTTDFMECGIVIDPEHAVLRILHENSVYISYAETENDSLSGAVRQFYHIKTVRVFTPDDRITLSIDYYHTDPEIGEWLLYAVSAFHRTHPEIRLSVNWLNVRLMGQEDIRAFMDERMLYEAHPDMILSGSARLDRYFDKGIFVDLSDAFSERLLGSAASSVSFGDALYTVPTATRMTTFVCDSSVTDTYLTWETFFEIIDTCGENDVLYVNAGGLPDEKGAAADIYENGIMDFFDPAAGIAAYDSDAFQDVIRYTEVLTDRTDTEAGALQCLARGTAPGYTNPTLPARLRDGGIRFLQVPLVSPEILLTLPRLFEDGRLNFCGYPSEDGGSAAIRNYGMAAVFSDSERIDIAEAFLSFLVSDDIQTHASHPFLPVTGSAMHHVFAQNRYLYYSALDFDAIGDPNVTEDSYRSFTYQKDGTRLGILSLSPLFTTPEPVDPEEYRGPLLEYHSESGKWESGSYVEVTLEQTYIDSVLHFLETGRMKAGSDETVIKIVNEELSYWEEGVGTLSDAAKKIQSRVQIYLSE